jgi:hypothetical protein
MRLLLHTQSSTPGRAERPTSFAGQVSVERPGILSRILASVFTRQPERALQSDSPEVLLSSEQLAGHLLITGEPGFGADSFLQWVLDGHVSNGGGFFMLDAHRDSSLFSKASRSMARACRAEEFRALIVQDFAVTVGDAAETPWLRISRAMRLHEGLYAGLSVMHAQSLGEGRGRALLEGLEASIERRREMENAPLSQFLVVVTDADQFPADRLVRLLDKGRENSVAFVLVTASMHPESAPLSRIGTAAVFRQRRGESTRFAQQLVLDMVKPGLPANEMPRYLVESAGQVVGLSANQCLLADSGGNIRKCSLLA